MPSPVYFEPWHGHRKRCVRRSGLPPTVGLFRPRQRLGPHRAAEVGAHGRDGVEGLAVAEDEQALVGQELQPVRELRRRAELHRRRRVVGDVRHERAQRGAGLRRERDEPAPAPSLSRKSRRSVVCGQAWRSLMRVLLGWRTGMPACTAGRHQAFRDRERLHRHGVGGAADGAEAAADAALVVLDHRRQRQAVASGARRRADVACRPSRSSVLERHDGEAVLGADVDAAVAQDALLRVVDRLHVADEAARGLLRWPRRGRSRSRPRRCPVRRPTSSVGGGPRSRRLEARDHPVARRGDLLDRRACARGVPPPPLEVLVDRAGGAFAVGDGLDEVPRAERDVAAGEDAGRGGGQRGRIDLDRARRASGRRRPRGFRNERSALLADGEDAGVGLERRARRRRRSAGRSGRWRRRRSGRRAARPPTAPVAEEAQRAAARKERMPSFRASSNSSCPCVVRSTGISSKFSSETIVTSRAPAAQGRSRRVERLFDAGVGCGRRARSRSSSSARGVSRRAVRAASKATKPPPMTTTRRPSVHAVAAVDVQQVVDRLHDAVEFDAGDLQVAALRDADREEDGARSPRGAGSRGRSSGSAACRAEVDAEREDLVDLRRG